LDHVTSIATAYSDAPAEVVTRRRVTEQISQRGKANPFISKCLVVSERPTEMVGHKRSSSLRRGTIWSAWKADSFCPYFDILTAGYRMEKR